MIPATFISFILGFLFGARYVFDYHIEQRDTWTKRFKND